MSQSNRLFPMTCLKLPKYPRSNGLAPGSVSRMAKVRSSVCVFVSVCGADCGGEEADVLPLDGGGVFLGTAGCGGKMEVDCGS